MPSKPVISIVLAALSLALAGNALAANGSGPGDLVKTACPAGSGADHPCRAVYYWAADGRRRAFPNERVYFSWYKDFSTVKAVSAEALAALPLGRNVTYRPGSRLVKLQTADQVYAVDAGGTLRWVASEPVADAIFGAGWNRSVDDISDALFSDYAFGAPIGSAADYDPASRLLAAPDIDADAGATWANRQVTTADGAFSVQIVTLDRRRYALKTLVAAPTDCTDGCAAKPLADYAASAKAGIAIHGTYFCPPDYPACTGKTESFLWPMFDSASGQMRNAGAIPLHQAPIIVSYRDGQTVYYRRADAFKSLTDLQNAYGSPIDAAIANYPGLVDNGQIIVNSEPRLEESQRTVKGVRGALGFDQDKFFLVIAKNATVVDLAGIMQTIGATFALNLDGGGSAAMLYGGVYKAGPGRVLPNAIVFVKK